LKGSNQRKRREEIQSEGHGKTMQSWELAQRVSIKVETELSRIYGKENARSRLLNLKDRNYTGNATNSVTVVVVLLATIAFAPLFTVPGGYGYGVYGDATVDSITLFQTFLNLMWLASACITVAFFALAYIFAACHELCCSNRWHNYSWCVGHNDFLSCQIQEKQVFQDKKIFKQPWIKLMEFTFRVF